MCGIYLAYRTIPHEIVEPLVLRARWHFRRCRHQITQTNRKTWALFGGLFDEYINTSLLPFLEIRKRQDGEAKRVEPGIKLITPIRRGFQSISQQITWNKISAINCSSKRSSDDRNYISMHKWFQLEFLPFKSFEFYVKWCW